MKTEACLSAAMKTGTSLYGLPPGPPLWTPLRSPVTPVAAFLPDAARSIFAGPIFCYYFFILRSLPLALQMSNVVNDMDEPLSPDSQAYVDELQPVQGVAHTT